MQICIFEDNDYIKFEPLSFYRPAFDLVCGITTLREKIIRAYPGLKYSLHCRLSLAPFLQEQNPGIKVNSFDDDDHIFVNGSVLAPLNMMELIPAKGSDKIYLNGSKIIAAKVSRENLKRIKKNSPDILNSISALNLPNENTAINYAAYIWDLISNNKTEMLNDYNYFYSSIKAMERIKGKIFEGAHLVNKENIIIAEGAEAKPGAVIDASSGPVYIDRNASIQSNAVIQGPVYIGKSSLIKTGANIYDSVSIGKVCKIGGEVDNSIILPYSNKQHNGYIGHSYIGSWVNIGADTTCSDLKNNYSSVKAYVNGRIVDSGQQFLGPMIGDHTKTAINTMFNTGTSVGFSCNVFGSGFPDTFIPSFSWGGRDSFETYEVEKSIATARRVMQRRNKIISKYEEDIFKYIFASTETERRQKGY